jgi:hypothetical protein
MGKAELTGRVSTISLCEGDRRAEQQDSDRRSVGFQKQFFAGCLIFRFFTEHNQRLASVSRTRFLGSMPRSFRLSSDDSASSIPGPGSHHACVSF